MVKVCQFRSDAEELASVFFRSVSVSRCKQTGDVLICRAGKTLASSYWDRVYLFQRKNIRKKYRDDEMNNDIDAGKGVRWAVKLEMCPGASPIQYNAPLLFKKVCDAATKRAQFYSVWSDMNVKMNDLYRTRKH